MSSAAPVSHLSRTASPAPRWSAAVFAHNEAGRIAAAVLSLQVSAAGRPIAITVLANGCRDDTAAEVRALASRIPNLSLVELDLADKANAWNVYVHDILTDDAARDIDVHFFLDGDVTAGPHAAIRLASALRERASRLAAGALPGSGRDREAWRRRMASTGTLAGGLYALRGTFVEDVRQSGVRLPVGLIGEDWLVSRLTAPVALVHDAEFFFRSLSPWRPGDIHTFIRREWRYALRGVQFEMLHLWRSAQSLDRLPSDVTTLYRAAPVPSRLRWIGRRTLLRTLAVQYVRGLRHRIGNGS